jgi:hypothetical protein
MGVVGGIIGDAQPPLAPPYQGGEQFSCQVMSRRIMKSALRMTHCEFQHGF